MYRRFFKKFVFHISVNLHYDFIWNIPFLNYCFLNCTGYFTTNFLFCHRNISIFYCIFFHIYLYISSWPQNPISTFSFLIQLIICRISYRHLLLQLLSSDQRQKKPWIRHNNPPDSKLLIIFYFFWLIFFCDTISPSRINRAPVTDTNVIFSCSITTDSTTVTSHDTPCHIRTGIRNNIP